MKAPLRSEKVDSTARLSHGGVAWRRTIWSCMLTLYAALPPRRRSQLWPLVGLMLVGAFAEVLSLAAIVPFLALLTDPVRALEAPMVSGVVSMLGLTASADIKWQLTVVFAVTAVVAGGVRFFLIYAIAKFNFGMGHELGAEVYRRTLYQSYEVHVARNSSEILGGIQKVDIVVWLVFSLLTAASAVLMAVCIVAALLFVDPFVAMAALLGFGTVYVTVSIFTRKQLAANSHSINVTYNKRVQEVQEGLGGIRDVLLDHAQPVFARRFNEIDWPLRQAQASNNIIEPSPRFVVEALGMVVFAMLGYYMASGSGGVLAAIPTLGALALGAQRLMPLLQQIYKGWMYVAGNREVLSEVVGLLEQPIANEASAVRSALQFDREIRLDNVSFRYQSQMPLVLQAVNLTIPKGARVGFVGTTGSGKSTAMDLLMGLLDPTEGQISIDGIPLDGSARLAWQRSVGHVPQSIFLADGSFAENIAFGVDPAQIDFGRVREAACRAQIDAFIESGPDGYQALVGERGVRLSGGQRQRLGIARALYKDVEVLVFDEATSALDSETEAAVMHAIDGLGEGLTVLMIAHRVSTLRNCSCIVEMSGGRITRTGSYENMVASQASDADKRKQRERDPTRSAVDSVELFISVQREQ